MVENNQKRSYQIANLSDQQILEQQYFYLHGSDTVT